MKLLVFWTSKFIHAAKNQKNKEELLRLIEAAFPDTIIRETFQRIIEILACGKEWLLPEKLTPRNWVEFKSRFGWGITPFLSLKNKKVIQMILPDGSNEEAIRELSAFIKAQE